MAFPTPGANISALLQSASVFRGALTPGISASLKSAGLLSGSIARPANPVSTSMVSASRLGGYILDGTPPTAGGNAAVEWEARLYDVNGKRIRMPLQWVDTLEFEIGENGGNLNGSVTVLAPWETLQLTGNERVDVWMWGALIYRGYVRIPQSDEATPEKHQFTLHGLMQKLSGILVRRNFAYSVNTDIGDVFRGLVNFYLNRPGRFLNLAIDTTGVSSLNITMTTFDATGRDFAQAMNDLVNVSPGSLIWGCDVDINSQDRIFLRPRTQTVKYRYSVGDKVQAFVYPVDTTQVVNGMYVTGAQMRVPNLAPNASFEKCVAPGEATSNMLLSPSFEDASGGTIPNWIVTGNPTAATTNSHTGSVSLDMDNNPSTEIIGQSVYLPSLPATVSWSVYARCPAGETWHLNVHLDLYNSSNTALSGFNAGRWTVPSDGLWYRFSGSWLAPATAGAVKVRLVIFPDAADSGANGMLIDDAALWFSDVQAQGWQPGGSTNAQFNVLDFQNRDIAAYDGDIVVKAQPTIQQSGGYGEVVTAPASQITVKTNRTYIFAAYVSGDVLNPPIIALGARGSTGGVMSANAGISAKTTVSSGIWRLITYQFSTGAADGVQLIMRFYNNNACYVDAVGLWENNVPTQWYPDKNYYAHRTVSDYSGIVSSAAAASITNYGLREKEVSQAQVIDQGSLDVYLKGYFNVHAVPVVQARLDLFGPTSALLLDGAVQVVNLPSEPPSLFPSRVRYRIGPAVTIEADLGNQRPDMAQLLQIAAQSAPNPSARG